MNYEVRLRLKALAADFYHYLQVFDEQVPFGKPGQREYHSETIAARKDLGSAAAAIDDERFMQLLWETLLAWGIGSRGSRLEPYSDFCRAMRERKKEISALDGLCIDDPCLNVDEVISRLWHLIETMDIVTNHTKLVAGFRCYGSQFQYGQRRFFEQAYRGLAELARDVASGQYVGDGWRTSRTKVLDNALIAYCQENRLSLA
jgi:hypothetical protein